MRGTPAKTLLLLVVAAAALAASGARAALPEGGSEAVSDDVADAEVSARDDASDDHLRTEEFATHAPSPPATPATNVVTVTADNFEEISNGPLALIEFFAPWCGHCKSLAPEFEAAADDLKRDDPPVVLGAVDATVEGALAQRFGVTGYPTLYIFRSGVKYEYDGPRERRGIVEHMRQQAGPASRVLASAKAVKALHADDGEPTVVGFFAGKSDEAPTGLHRAFLEAAAANRNDYRFGHVLDAAACAQFAYEGRDTVVVFTPKRFHSVHEAPQHVFDNPEGTAHDLTGFMARSRIPLVGALTPTSEKFYSTLRPLLYAFFDVDFSHAYRKNTQFWREQLVSVAKDVPQLHFVIADEQTHQQSLIPELGLDGVNVDVAVGIKDADGRKYRLSADEDFSTDVLRAFVDDWTAGRLAPYVKSAPAPKGKERLALPTTVVGSTFEAVVLDGSKDVLLAVTAPWCGHCKALKPDLKKLARRFKDDPDLVVAEVDATANDLPPEFQVEGFPTLFWAARDGKNAPEKYEGARDLAAMSRWVRAKATVELRAPKKNGKKAEAGAKEEL